MHSMSSLRMPQSFTRRNPANAADAALRHEIGEEQAASLGRVSRKAEAALAALRDCQGEARPQMLKTAADAVWCMFVQREVMGLRDRSEVVRDYAIPREVMNRLGMR